MFLFLHCVNEIKSLDTTTYFAIRLLSLVNCILIVGLILPRNFYEDDME